MPRSKTFLITGVSSGLGCAFAAGALAAGHRVIGTVRRDAESPPTRLFLGEDALGLVTQKLEQMKSEIAIWDALSRSTNFGP